MKLDKLARKYRQCMESRLSDKGILFEHISDCEQVAGLKNNWLSGFAVGIKTNDIYADQFMWHIFSYQRMSCIEGDEATTRFLSQNKGQCYILFQHHSDAYYLENAAALTQCDIIGGSDFVSSDLYVVSKNFSWTYVVTHESDFGPYFYHKNIGDTIFL